MLNILDVSARFENQWLVLDKLQNVVDHGPELLELWEKHQRAAARLTFYFASSARP